MSKTGCGGKAIVPSIFDDDHFEVLTSTVQSAGKGLFTKVEILPGDTIGEYSGVILTDEQVESSQYIGSDYVLWICKDCNILGEGPTASYTRYINHSSNPNARFVCSTRWKKARVEALSNIFPGQEIFVDYGPYYWEAKGILYDNSIWR